MLLYHCSPVTNRVSILNGGLLTMMSKGRARRVWACQRHKIPWAVRHTLKRHADAEHGVDVWVAWVPDSTLRRSGRKGLFYTEVDVAPVEIGLFATFASPPWELEGKGEGE